MTRGFTLLEMVVVLAIMGITAAAVVPAFTRIAPEDGVVRATRGLERVLTAARTAALERAIATEVVLVPQTGRYWVRTGDGSAFDSGSIDLEPGVTFASTAPRPRIRFAPAGSAAADSLLVLGPDAVVSIMVDAWTGELHAKR